MTDEETALRATSLRTMDAEIAKLIAETSKINSKGRWYPAVVGSGITLAIVATAKLFL